MFISVESLSAVANTVPVANAVPVTNTVPVANTVLATGTVLAIHLYPRDALESFQKPNIKRCDHSTEKNISSSLFETGKKEKAKKQTEQM